MKRPICRYCRRDLLHPDTDRARSSPLSATKDHVIPKSRGGTFTAWCCRQCNQIKADMSLIEWARFMQSYPEWWQRFRTRGQVNRELYRARYRQELKSRFPFFVALPPLCRGLVA